MRIRLFGDLEIFSPEGDQVRFSTRKSSLLFAALVLSGPKGQRRERLAEALWPGRAEAQARNSLRQALTEIRRNFPLDADEKVRVEGDKETIAIITDPEDLDVKSFEKICTLGDGKRFAVAADLYRGDLVSAEAIPEAADEFIFQLYRSRYQRMAQELAEKLSMIVQPMSAAETSCQALAERFLVSDPTSESAHRALIRIHASRGHENAALRQFENCRTLLKKNLEVEPEAQTMALVRTLRSGQGPTFVPQAGLAKDFAQTDTSPARLRDQPSVAVLPFDNLGASDDEYFADGVVEEITAALSRIRDFFVIARQSAFTYKGRFVDVNEVGKELNVDYVVEGTLRRGGDRLRISVQLVEAASRTQLWSERYEGTLEDIFELQDRIAEQVSGAIRPAIRGAEIELSGRKPPTNLKAYDLVLRAYPHLWGRREGANKAAIRLLQDAITADPTYGRAHALLAWCHAANAAYLWSGNPENDLRAATSAVNAAGTLGDDPTALAAAGAAISICGDQRRAASLIEQALELDPNSAWAWTRWGWIAIYTGAADRAKERFERAMSLSPMDPLAFNMKIGLAASVAMSGSPDQAVEIARTLINSNPDVSILYRYLAAWSGMSGDLETARWAAQKLLAVQPDFTIKQYRALPMFKDFPGWGDRMAEGLRKAGLPE